MNDYGSLRFVDSVPNANPALGDNLLFRGSMPVVDYPLPSRPPPFPPPNALPPDALFDLIGLNGAFHRVYPKTPQLGDYYLVDISLVYDGDPGLAVERRHFSVPDNANFGQLVWWPTYGSLRCYYQTPAAEQDRLVRTFDEWLPDTLIRRTETLRYMLETSWLPGPTPSFWPGYNGKPCVFYVHCEGGCDRTAEIIGAYRLRYQGHSWLQMYDEQPCGRPMGCSNYRALQWYAIWLNRMFGFDLAPYGDNGCSDPSPPAPGPGPWHACSP
jgi:hypothetical protein